ncbi:MAG: AAA family ATPase [Alphaproteobacteria bacterium]|nr:AAA family ATPase [Alphaproteobacteria bacterium]
MPIEPDRRRPGAVTEDQSDTIAFLASGAGRGAPADEIIETHGAMVFLCGDRAYKLKRAVWFPYMDFSTIGKRRAFCRAEVRLNRRTAPEVYLDALPVARDAGGALALGGSGAPLDWVVVMRRFDQDALFDRLARRGALDEDLIDALADTVAHFHGVAEPLPDVDFAAGMERVIAGNEASLSAFSPDVFPAEEISELQRLCAERFDNGAHDCLRRRGRDGFVRQCHGDLHLKNLFLCAGKPVLFDCIEFDNSLAQIDVFYDLAFLLMDLEFRGLRRYANLLLNRYIARTGDYDGVMLLPLFMAVRAAIRAHVTAATAATSRDASMCATHRDAARAYFDLAMRLAKPAPSGLIAIGGLSGSGKSRLARSIAPNFGGAAGALVVRSDVIRKQMFGVDIFERLPEAAYTKESSRAVYARLTDICTNVLAGERWVVADAVFGDSSERAAIEAAATNLDRPFVGIWLDVSEPVQRMRLAKREHDVSDASPAIGGKQRSGIVTPEDWHVVDAGGTPDDTADAAWRLLQSCGIPREACARSIDH